MLIQEWQDDPLKYVIENNEFLVLGIFTLIFLIVTLLISGKMIYRGLKVNNKLISYVGISYFGVASCWLGVALNFLSVIILNIIPPWELYFMVHGGIVIIALVFWIAAMTDLLMFKDKTRKSIIAIAAILAVAADIIYFIVIFISIELLGTPVAPIQVEYGLFSYGYLTTILVVFLIFGGMFVRESLKANEPIINLKGKFLGASFIVFTIASVLEVFFKEIWIFVIGRIIVLIAGILFYIGFLMPKPIENALLK